MMVALMLAALLQADPPVPGAPDPAPAAAGALAQPAWRQRATGEDLARVYPRQAARRRVEGIAMVTCTVTKEGDMAGCRVEQEAPMGEGFGEAALKLMPKFRMHPLTRNGLSVEGGVVRIPIQFRLPR